jgi:hypothetical protein
VRNGPVRLGGLERMRHDQVGSDGQGWIGGREMAGSDTDRSGDAVEAASGDASCGAEEPGVALCWRGMAWRSEHGMARQVKDGLGLAGYGLAVETWSGTARVC